MRQTGAIHGDDAGAGRVMESIDPLGKTQVFELDGAEALPLR
jgi:hypothetical protein